MKKYLFSIFLIQFLMISSSIYPTVTPGFQDGWEQKNTVETSQTGYFSISGQELTTTLKVTTSSAPGVVKNDTMIVHNQNRLTIDHIYPVLPPDVELTSFEMFSNGGFSSQGTSSEANAGECIPEIYAYFQCIGPDSGSVSHDTKTLHVRAPYVLIEYRFGDNFDPVPYGNPFLPITSARIADLTDNTDFMNMTYDLKAEAWHPWVNDVTLPAEGIQFRLKYCYSDLTFIPFYITDWYETDEEGEVSITVGSGGTVLEAKPLLTKCNDLYLIADGTFVGYGENKRIEKALRSTKGTVTINVTNPEGTPVSGVQINGGGAFYLGGTTNSSGSFSTEVNGGGSDNVQIDITIPPHFELSNRITQVVDDIDESNVHSQGPAYYVAGFEIDDEAKDYFDNDHSYDDFTLQIFENGVQAAEISNLKAKCDNHLTDDERAKGTYNSYWYPVLPEDSAKLYTHAIVWEDDNHDESPLSVTVYRSKSIQANRVPELDRPFHIHYVGLETPGVVTLRGKGVMSTWASPSKVAKMNDYFTKLYPAPVKFTYGPDLKTSNPWFMIGQKFTNLSYFVDLEKHIKSLSPRPDLIVGVSGPGVIGADGLSEPRFYNVVLLDGSALNKHYLLHEYMHTLGLLDNYDYENGIPNYGASANGYDPETSTRIYNKSGATKPEYQTVMYDRGPKPWITQDDYSVLLNAATVPLVDKSLDKTPPTKQEVMYIGAMVIGEQRWSSFNYFLHRLDPIFVDVDQIDQPQETTDPSYNAIRLTLSNGQEATVKEFGGWYYDDYPEGGQGLAAAPLIKFPYDSSVNSLEVKTVYRDGTIRTFANIDFSPNAPQLTITHPNTGSTLFDWQSIGFTANDVDENEQLYAWIKISLDGGSTFTPVDNWFEVDRGYNSFDLDCTRFANSENVKLRVLLSDGTRSVRSDIGPFTLKGTSSVPVAHPSPAWYDFKVKPGSIFTLPVTIRNRGGETLTVNTDTANLPNWIDGLNTNLPLTITPAGEGKYLYRGSLTQPGEYTTTLEFTTNDPNQPQLTIPLTINAVDEDVAPVIASLASSLTTEPGEITLKNDNILFSVREITGNLSLDGRIEIYHALTMEKLAEPALSLTEDGSAYEVLWHPTNDVLGLPLGVEAVLEDPQTQLASQGGANPIDWDMEFTLIERNTPPHFTTPTQEVNNVAVTFPTQLEIPFAATDDQGDAIRYAINFSKDLDVLLDEENHKLLVSYIYNNPTDDTHINLVATDKWGASSAVRFDVGVYWPSKTYAYINNQTTTMLTGSPLKLQISSVTSQRPRSVLLEYKTDNNSNWSSLGTLTDFYYNHSNSFWTVDYDWYYPNDPNALSYQLRLTLTDDTGTVDSDPPVYHYYPPRQGGAVTRIETPSNIPAGSDFTIKVHVQNLSSESWSSEKGYELFALYGTDELTGLRKVNFMPLQQIERGATGVVELQVSAPDATGVYQTSWGVRHKNRGPIGPGASASVEVTRSTSALNQNLIVNTLLKLHTPDSSELEVMDSNGDNLIDIADQVNR